MDRRYVRGLVGGLHEDGVNMNVFGRKTQGNNIGVLCTGASLWSGFGGSPPPPAVCVSGHEAGSRREASVIPLPHVHSAESARSATGIVSPVSSSMNLTTGSTYMCNQPAVQIESPWWCGALVSASRIELFHTRKLVAL